VNGGYRSEAVRLADTLDPDVVMSSAPLTPCRVAVDQAVAPGALLDDAGYRVGV
jgi:hypothetical protein